MADNPEYVKAFAEAMEVLGLSPGYLVEHVVYGYDWKGLGKARTVDVR